MSQENLNFVEVPSNGKHNKILYEGQLSFNIMLTMFLSNKKSNCV